MTNNKHPENAPVLVAKQLFGDHPLDVISPIHSASEALGWLEEVFRIIQQEVKAGNTFRVQMLSEMGAHIALDAADYAAHMHETYAERLRVNGLPLHAIDN